MSLWNRYRRPGRRRLLVLGLAVGIIGCGEPAEPPGEARGAADVTRPAPAAAAPPESGSAVTRDPLRNAYFGDLHVHTRYSFDAFVFGTRTGPDDAYRFAKGESIPHPGGFPLQLRAPLDFQAVTDHAAYLGMLPEMADPETAAGRHPAGRLIQEVTDTASRRAAFQAMGDYFRGTIEDDDLLDLAVVRSAWQAIIDSAERHNDPGTFTTFIGYEYTSSGPERENLHRNVIFRGSQVPDIPFSRLDDANPEKLWAWMDDLRSDGVESLAIPHNANGSNGMMFELTDWAGDPIDAAYAALRMRNEPLVEVTQVKGTSETHPLLSPNDEWADFEIFPYRIATTLPSQPAGGYVRDAYLRGLMIEAETGANPYRFGLAGASDTHVSAGSFSEFDYWSKTGLLDYRDDLRGSTPDVNGDYSDAYFRFWSASGLTGVWAEANTREDIYDAFRRKETFATTGPRIQIRFFAGYGLEKAAAERDVAALYAGGIPMGGDLLARSGGAAPVFIAWALRDPLGAPLERLQIIKGWIDDGQARERVFDVACAGGAAIDAGTHRCPASEASVDLTDCRISADAGAAELAATWQDPEFDAGQNAFYYVRVLENPTCRWSTWDALRADLPPRPDLPATLQERAWSSPIWFRT